MVKATEYNNYYCFNRAAKNGHLEVIEYIYNILMINEQDRNEMLECDGEYYAFCNAAKTGHLAIIKQLYAWANEVQRREMILSGTAYDIAFLRGHEELVSQIYNFAVELRSTEYPLTPVMEKFRGKIVQYF